MKHHLRLCVRAFVRAFVLAYISIHWTETQTKDNNSRHKLNHGLLFDLVTLESTRASPEALRLMIAHRRGQSHYACLHRGDPLDRPRTVTIQHECSCVASVRQVKLSGWLFLKPFEPLSAPPAPPTVAIVGRLEGVQHLFSFDAIRRLPVVVSTVRSLRLKG